MTGSRTKRARSGPAGGGSPWCALRSTSGSQASAASGRRGLVGDSPSRAVAACAVHGRVQSMVCARVGDETCRQKINRSSGCRADGDDRNRPRRNRPRRSGFGEDLGDFKDEFGGKLRGGEASTRFIYPPPNSTQTKSKVLHQNQRFCSQACKQQLDIGAKTFDSDA